MKNLLRLAAEARHMFRVLDLPSFLRWLWLVVVHSPEIARSGSLGVVDEAFGSAVKFRIGGRFFSMDRCALGLVREIVGSECYVRAADLRECRSILDLGSNCGVFTLFCLASAPDARVVGVEVQPELVEAALENIGRAGFASRAKFLNAYAGEESDFIRSLAGGKTVRFSPEDYLSAAGGCDFMKCDIEGAEYSLITPAATWLRQVRKISLEYHGTWEQGAGLGQILRDHGFVVSQHPHGTLGYLVCDRP
jgi:hypothetical protein